MSEPRDTIRQHNESMVKITLKESSPSIPWRKPTERPEDWPELFRECMFKVQAIEGVPHTYVGRVVADNPSEFYSDDGDTFSIEYVLCWCYADEIPLPDWVLK